MPSADKHEYDQQLLTQYLLGALSEVDTERVDEWSVTDDELAESLDAVENDLVDAYVRGELSGDTLDRFKQFYLSSRRRREKVEISRALLRYVDSAARALTPAAAARAIPGTEVFQESLTPWFPWRRFQLPRWGLACAVLLGLFVTGYLFVENRRLQRQGAEAQERQVGLERRAKELEEQLNAQRSTSSEMPKELQRLQVPAEPRPLKVVAALLLPQTRGVGEVTTISLVPGTNQVQLWLQLESDDFSAYRVALKDVTREILWNSASLKAQDLGARRTVAVSFPAHLLKKQNYVLELTGVSPGGNTEFLSSYPIRVTAP